MIPSLKLKGRTWNLEVGIRSFPFGNPYFQVLLLLVFRERIPTEKKNPKPPQSLAARHHPTWKTTPSIGDGNLPTFNEPNPSKRCFWTLKMWVDNHPLLYGKNGSLDSSTRRMRADQSTQWECPSTNIPFYYTGILVPSWNWRLISDAYWNHGLDYHLIHPIFMGPGRLHLLSFLAYTDNHRFVVLFN